MSTLTKTTRTVKKLEVPRPLKSSNSSIQTRSSVLDLKISTVDDLIVLTQTVACEISLGNYDRYFQANVSLMYSHLKTHGAQLETMYKDLLDKFFILFRNGSQDENLDKKSRLHLLELIELRAKNWQDSENMNHYYKHRVTHAEPALVATADLMAGVDVLSIPLGSPPPAIASPNSVQSTVAEIAPPLLGPGEIIKPSGKFPKPTKIPGKNYSKDEVVIRNADSGKVMGIKGRRVHMIEELSDTIISFQRVSPGAKERLVQITGPNEENVNHAKHLIGDTIRRNASPVRLEGATAPLRSSNSSLNSSGSDDVNATQQSLLHSMSSNDVLGEFRYTVTVGPNNYIKLIGNNLQILNEAKVLLDERFENFIESDTAAGEIGDFFRIGNKLSIGTDLDQNTVNNLLSNGLPSPSDDDVFVKNSSEESNSEMSRRMRFSRSLSSSDKKPASPLSKVPPRVDIPADMARKSILQLTEEMYSRKGSEDKPIENSPEKETST